MPDPVSSAGGPSPLTDVTRADAVLPPVSQPSVSQLSMRGAMWLLGRRLLASVVRVAAVAVLARRLSPAQFGLVALASVVLQLGTLFSDGGIGAYVICDRDEGHERRAQGAFWLNAAVTLGQVTLVVAALPLVTRLYPQDGLPALLLVLAAVFFVQQMSVVPTALVQRDLGHPSLARRDMALDVLTAATSVVLALAGVGVWSLVLPLVAAEPLRLAWTMALARWRPGSAPEREAWRPILRYAWPLMGSQALTLVSNDGDTLVVGKALGAGPLGYYNVAWQLSNLVGRSVTAAVSMVALPALAMVRHDLARLRAAYLRTMATLALACFPALVMLFVLADEVVTTVYGERWRPAATLLRIFIVFTLARSVTSPSSNVYNVLGRTDVGFKFTVGFTPVYLAAVLAGSRHGLAGVAAGVAAVRTAGAVLDTLVAARLVGVRGVEILRTLAPTAAVTVVAGAVTATAAFVAGRAGIGSLGTMAVAALAGGAAYLVAAAAVRPPGYDDVRRLLPRRRGDDGGSRQGTRTSPEENAAR